MTNWLGTPVGYKLVPGGAFPPMMHPDSPVLAPRAGDRPHALGDPVPRGRALAVRRVRRPERGGPRPAGVDRAGPPDRGHGHRALVRVRHPPHHAPGGVAGDVGGHRLLLAQAGRLLRPQPGARRGAERPPLPARRRTDEHRDHQLHPRRAGRRRRRRDDRPDRPQHRRGVRDRRAVAAGRRRRRVPGRRARVRGAGATRRRASASARCCGSPTRSRSAPTSSSTVESQNTGKPTRADDVGGGPADVRPDPLLRRRRPRARGQVGRRVHERLHVVTSGASRSASAPR